MKITLLRVIPTMTFIRFNIGISSGIPPGHWHICKQAIAFFLLCDLLAGLPLHSRMSPGVTACSSGCKTNMPRHVGVHLHHSCHVACSAAWKTNIPRHVGDHLNHSCRRLQHSLVNHMSVTSVVMHLLWCNCCHASAASQNRRKLLLTNTNC